MTEPRGDQRLGTLIIPLATAWRELTQIRSWIQPRHDHPFGDAETVEKFGGQLKGLINKAEDNLRQIQRDFSDGRTRQAWERYAVLQREDLPQLANELLAVIGGRYLGTRNLDDMRPLLGEGNQRPDSGTISFSSVARDLLNDLSNRTGGNVGSLLIVAEERQVAIGAGIVRLRFPACDVWNLPFTAHEYGYLVAQQDPPDYFRQFKDQVERGIDPSTHTGSGEAVMEYPYLPEVTALWESYRADQVRLSGDIDQQPGVLRDLRSRQIAHVCRLFADAFATYFAGPAYVYALLHLRFWPDRYLLEPDRTVPAFVDRFVVAAETLRRMDEDQERYRDIDFGLRSPFVDVLDPSTGLLSTWTRFLEDAGQPKDQDPYQEAAARLKPWIDQIWRSVTNPDWRDENNRPVVYDCWKQSLDLVEMLTGEKELQVESRPRPWAVVNAAWSARMTPGSDAQVIEEHAIRLLNRNDEGVVRPRKAAEALTREAAAPSGRHAPMSPAQERPSQAGPDVVADDRRTVQLALFTLGEEGHLAKLEEDWDREQPPFFRNTIYKRLNERNQRAAEAYRRLCGMADPNGGATE